MANNNSKNTFNRGYNPAKVAAKGGSLATYLNATLKLVAPAAAAAGGATVKAGYRAGKVYVTGAGVTAATAFTVAAALSPVYPAALVSVKVRAGKPGRVTVTLPPRGAGYYTGANKPAVNPVTGAFTAAAAPRYTGTLAGGTGVPTPPPAAPAAKPATRRRRRGRGSRRR